MRKPPDIPIDDQSEPSSTDMNSLTYLGLWGGAAAVALLMLASATMSETGQRRLAMLFSGGVQAAAIDGGLTIPADAEFKNRRLADQLRNLSEDRDRLLARVTVLERNYEGATGSIARIANTPKPLPELSSPVVSALPEPATRTAIPAPDSIEGLLAKAEFGVDLGGASNVAALRAAWDRIRRSHAAQLEGLRPVIGIREGQTGQIELRLVVGPISNAGVASKLCASLANAGVSCQPTTFDGQRLALR